MKEVTKRHISIRGYYVPCGAEKRTCPRGGHVTEAAFQQLKAAGDVRALPVSTKEDPKGSTAAARHSYEVAARQIAKYEKMRKELIAMEQSELAKINASGEKTTSRDYTSEYMPHYTVLERWSQLRSDTLDRIKDLYIEQGVNPNKAGWLASDTLEANNLQFIKGEPFTLKTSTKDRLDPEIKAKTQAARTAAKTDPGLAALRDRVDAYSVALGKRRATHNRINKRAQRIIAKHGLNPNIDMRTLQEEAAKHKAQLQLQTQWTAAGVPDGHRYVNTGEGVLKKNVSTDENSNINNVFLLNADNTPQKVVGIIKNSWVTEDGHLHERSKHYHSYRMDVRDPKVIVTPLNGNALGADGTGEQKAVPMYSMDTGG